MRFRHVVAPLASLALMAAGCGGSGDEDAGPKPGRKGEERQAAQRLGFPVFATKNTTRVGGADAIADAAAVALAVFPDRSVGESPEAVALVDHTDWHGGIAAAALFGAGARVPVLLTEGREVPSATREALEALQPRGGSLTRDAQVLAIGQVPVPPGLRAHRITGAQAEGARKEDRGEPAAVAVALDRFQAGVARRRSSRVLVVSQDDPEFAMPAAAWAARSGDPVLLVTRDAVPAVTRSALRRHRKPTIYVLGPPSTISGDVIRALRTLGREVHRVSGPNPVENAIAFARYLDGSFGWNVNDPGHGFVVASISRPLDAVAAGPLSGSGKYGPLLLTDSQEELPPALEEFFLDVKPGYRDDPTRAVYNHVWLMGDESAVAPGVQAELDELAEVAQIESASPEGGR